MIKEDLLFVLFLIIGFFCDGLAVVIDLKVQE
jgi:hypothetical protein